MSEKEIEALFSSFKKSRVLIIGDIMLDAYLWGEVDRISPEAPVPVVSVKHRENRLGGAANVARNIKALGAEPVICSVIGDDARGAEFLEILKNENMSTEGILRSSKRITTTKFRVLGNNTQMLRVDEEMTQPLREEDASMLQAHTERLLLAEKVDAVIFQDYDKGTISKELIQRITSRAKALSIPVAVDPKKKHFADYKHVTLFKPNLKELKEGVNGNFNRSEEYAVEAAAHQLHQQLECDMLMVTLSDKGILMRYSQRKKDMFYEPAHRREIADVSGAGDTVISVATLCLSLNMEPREIAALSNLAGGLVCEEAGVVPVDPAKFRKEISDIYQKKNAHD